MTRSASLSMLSLVEIARIMHDRAQDLKKLQKRRRECQRELDRVDAAIAKIASGRHSSAANGVGRPRNAVSLASTIEQVLAKAWSPVPVGEIAMRVEASAYHSTSANFRSVVNMNLVTNDRFESAGRGFYVLKGAQHSKRSKRHAQSAEAEAAE